MPWSEVDIMERRVQFIRDWQSHKAAVSEVCQRYKISRKTGYKWIDRFLLEGPDGLMDRTHAAHVISNRTPAEVEEMFLLVRQRHPSWGPKKLLSVVQEAHPELVLPHRATVAEILKRNGLVVAKPKRRVIGHPGAPNGQVLLANDCWSVDFKGQARLGDGSKNYPLTGTDNFSRYILGIKGMSGTLYQETKQEMTRWFKEYGLPKRIRSDNGVPFAAHTLGRLSRLSVWWIKLGITPELIEPGKPQQNGRHERMHRTLKAETMRPPAYNASAQQRRYNVFKGIFNDERPHEALDMRRPQQLYRCSPQQMPSKLIAPEYPDRFEVRYVSENGGIRWNKSFVNVTSSLVGENVGLEEVDEGQWDIYYGPILLGRLHERHMRIEDHMGRLVRRV